ncbi:nucleoside triphosphate pyrophosphatase [uncultured Mobiluncus sp.]|uniref:Maf family protein n=1 Tax=uncultured Mobiluncus sp. TaxID=293425 RepID=UPI00262BD0F8|nr:Maf family protein [uncultured Mobiluncus sp.]
MEKSDSDWGAAAVSVVLASASSARRKVLQGAGLRPVVRVSHVDEDALLAKLRARAAGPAEQVLALAQAKARAVAGELETSLSPGADALVVGCDSMLEFHGEVLGKPHNPEVALARVRALSGDCGVLHTGHWVMRLRSDATEAVAEVGRTESTVVHFTDFSEAEARAYVASGEPLEVAGSFTIDGLGGAFISGIEGDPHNVIGISLPLLRKLAGELGIFWPSLWS